MLPFHVHVFLLRKINKKFTFLLNVTIKILRTTLSTLFTYKMVFDIPLVVLTRIIKEIFHFDQIIDLTTYVH